MIVRSHPQECEECGWALAVSRLAWWRSRAGRSMVKGQISLSGTWWWATHTHNTHTHTVKQSDIPLDVCPVPSDVEMYLDYEMIKLDYIFFFVLHLTSCNKSVSSRQLNSFSYLHFT